MEDKRIEAMKNWPKLNSGRDIQVFLGFANFYQCFIQGFGKIARPLILMLQTTGPSKNLSLLMDVAKHNKVGTVGGGDDHKDEMVKRSLFKNLNRATGYLTPKARLAFATLKKAFTKALIL